MTITTPKLTCLY